MRLTAIELRQMEQSCEFELDMDAAPLPVAIVRSLLCAATLWCVSENSQYKTAHGSPT